MANNMSFSPALDSASDIARQQIEFGSGSPRVPGPSEEAHSAAVVSPHDGSLGVRPISAPPIRASFWTPV